MTDDMTVEDVLNDISDMELSDEGWEDESPDFSDGPECDGWEERSGINDTASDLDFNIISTSY